MLFPFWLRVVIFVSFIVQTVAWVWGTILDLRSRQKARADAQQRNQSGKEV